MIDRDGIAQRFQILPSSGFYSIGMWLLPGFLLEFQFVHGGSGTTDRMTGEPWQTAARRT
jgi:hypothetical protein